MTIDMITKCFWKEIAEKDKITKEKGLNKVLINNKSYDVVTFSENKPCMVCEGYNIQCDNYVAGDDI